MAYWVAKGLLCSTVQSLLQGGRLRVAPGLELAETLRDELLNFEVKVTEAANETYGCWRSGKHDDLVLAVALAVWVAQRHVAPRWGFYRSPTPWVPAPPYWSV
jgi:hypothetical protein